MGKKLIIKGADFSVNGILPSASDVTSTLLANLEQGGRGSDGTVTSKTTRVSGGIVAMTAISAEPGDTLVFSTPSKIYCAVLVGSTDSSFDTSNYWYGSDTQLHSSYKGESFVIPEGTNYVSIVFGKASGNYAGTTASITPTDIQNYINSNKLAISLTRAEE